MTRAVATRPKQDTKDSRVLYMAFELGRKEWKLGFTTGMAQAPRERTLRGGDVTGVEKEIRAGTYTLRARRC